MTQIRIALLTDGPSNHPNDPLTQLRTIAMGSWPQLAPQEYAVSSSPQHGWRELRGLRTRLLEDQVGAIHATSPGLAALTARWLSVRLSLPLIGSYHGSADVTWPRYEKWLFAKCTRVVVPSDFVGRDLVRAGYIRPDRLVIARAGVDACTFSPTKRSVSLRDAWRVSDRRPAILCIGPLVRRELDLLARVRSILDEYRRPHRFVVAACSGDTEAWQKAIPDAAFIAAPEDVDPAAVFASCDIFLSTGLAGYPDPAGSLLMAQASGLPVIAPDAGACHEAMLAGTTGYLCHAASEQDFAWRTAELLANTPRRASMATSAAAYARDRTWGSSLEPLFRGYSDVCRQAEGARRARSMAAGVRA